MKKSKILDVAGRVARAIVAASMVVSFAILVCVIAIALSGCGSFQSETTVFGIEVTTLGGNTMFPTGRAGLIRHKNQYTQAGQVQQFYNAESEVSIWSGTLGHAATGMTCMDTETRNNSND